MLRAGTVDEAASTAVPETGAAEGSAVLSPCGQFRYALARSWADGTGAVNFIMLNPSTADAVRDDPTIRRCVRLARRWGYQRLLVTNVFAYRTPDPRELRREKDACGPENERWLVAYAEEAARVVAAWGNHARYNGHGRRVRSLLVERGVALYHLGLTRAGEPRHPLYLPATMRPAPWEAS